MRQPSLKASSSLRLYFPLHCSILSTCMFHLRKRYASSTSSQVLQQLQEKMCVKIVAVLLPAYLLCGVMLGAVATATGGVLVGRRNSDNFFDGSLL